MTRPKGPQIAASQLVNATLTSLPVLEMAGPGDGPLGDEGLFEVASRLIEAGRATIAFQASSVQVAANWRLGRLIDREILNRGRADYGKQIQATLSHQLTFRFGSGFDETNLRRMVKFAREFPEEFQATLSPELSWSHIRELLPLKTQAARLFYAEEVAAKHLGVRELRQAISHKAYERREIANSQIPEGSTVPHWISSAIRCCWTCSA